MKIELDPHPGFSQPPTAPQARLQAPSTNPYATPTSGFSAPLYQETEQIQAVAKAQRMLLFSVLASLIGNVVTQVLREQALLMLPVMLGILIFNIWSIYRLCKALERSAILWIIAMFLPLINLICLLVLNGQATAFLKARGIKVGFMGARL